MNIAPDDEYTNSLIEKNPKIQQDSLLSHNEEIIQNLNKKIGRRLNIGYYIDVPTNSRNLIFPPRKYSPPKNTFPKRKHPIFKKMKRKDIPNMLDQQVNTDEISLEDEWQNTSGVYVKFEEGPEMKDQSLQWNEEKAVEVHRGVQYTLEDEVIECQDASIQYDLEEQQEEKSQKQVEQEEQEQVQEAKEEEKEEIQKIEKNDQEVQTEKNQLKENMIQTDTIQQPQIEEVQPIETSEKSIQFKPSGTEVKVQIDIPDQQKLKKIDQMNNHITYLRNEIVKNQKMHRRAKSKIEFMKIKEEISQLENQIAAVSTQQLQFNKKIEQQRKMQNLTQHYEREISKVKMKSKIQAEQKLNLSITEWVEKIKNRQARSKIVDNRYHEEEKKKKEELDNKQKEQKQELLNYRQSVVNLKEELKSEMFKRLKYYNQSDDDTVQDRSIKRRSSIGSIIHFTNKFQHIPSFNQIFQSGSPSKKIYAGSIIKNTEENPEKGEQSKINQHLMNNHYESVRMTKAYWRQKSNFNYKYSQISQQRSQRKEKYLNKLDRQLKNYQQEFTVQSQHQLTNQKISVQSKQYSYNSFDMTAKRLFTVKQKIDAFFSNPTYFKYLYGQHNKITAGYGLFSLFDIGLVQKSSIQIHRFPLYFVFSYEKESETHFIVIYHNKTSIFYSISPTKEIKSRSFYTSENIFKNKWGINYEHTGSIYLGWMKEGKKNGRGIYFHNHTLYDGEFKENSKSGKGQLSLENGDAYKGEFLNDRFHGEGIYHWNNGEEYEGFFKDGLRSGYGLHQYKNGDSYEGFYLNNKKHGKGTYKWKDGSHFEGTYIDDIKSGEGQLTQSDGSKTTGIWHNDILQKSWNDTAGNKRVERDELPILKRRKIK